MPLRRRRQSEDAASPDPKPVPGKGSPGTGGQTKEGGDPRELDQYQLDPGGDSRLATRRQILSGQPPGSNKPAHHPISHDGTDSR